MVTNNPSAIATIVSRNGKLVYEILLTSHFEKEETYQKLISEFKKACIETINFGNKIGVITDENVLDIYSGKDISGSIKVSNKDGTPSYDLAIVCHTTNYDKMCAYMAEVGDICRTLSLNVD